MEEVERCVTRFYKTNPNRTSGKIKLTPPVDSYTIVLVVLTLSTTQTTHGWFKQMSFLGGVQSWAILKIMLFDILTSLYS